MHRFRTVAILGSASILVACTSSPDGAQSGAALAEGGSEMQPAQTEADSGPSSDAGLATQDASAIDAGAKHDGGGANVDAGNRLDAMAPAPYTLTITSPQPNASVSGAVTVIGSGPGFLNVEVHSATGLLLARVTPAVAGDFSALVDTTRLVDGLQSLTVDGWDAPAGSTYTHHATASLPLQVSNTSDDAGDTDGGDAGANSGSDAGAGCLDSQGHGIQYFGAYTKNTQTNYDFNSWSGFRQDFLTSFINCDTWANMAASDWGFQIMSLQPPGENIMEIVCLSTTEDPLLQHVGAGMYDSYIQQIGQKFLQYNYPNAVIRLGHEFEGNWYPWGMLGGPNNMDYAGFISAFRRVAGILKGISPTFTIVWNPGCGYYAAAMNDNLAYPGDDVVDVIGVDCYDDGSGMDHLFNGAYGMNQWAQFAAQHGKPIALPEWGLMTAGGDDPAYIQAMFTFMTANDTFLEAFWDSDDGNTASQLSTGEDPSSGAMFLQTFSAYAKACHP